MKLGLRRPGTALAATAALAAGMTATAPAQAPAPCGAITTDPTGDQSYGLAGNQSGIPAAETVDITSLYFHRTPDGKTTANATIANLSKTVPSGTQGLVYRFFYTAGGTDHFLEADVDTAGAVTYTYGHIDTTLISDGEGTGQFIEGPNGTVSIDIPASHGGKLGVKFSEAYMLTAYSMGAFISSTDFAPDDDGRVSWSGSTCGAGATPPPSGGGTTPPPTGGGTTPPPGTTRPAPRPAASTGPLQVTVKPAAVKARKMKKARKLALRLASKEQLTNVVVTLRKGKKALGAGKLASLAGNGKVTLKLKRKGLKKGAYSILVAAKRADGSNGTATLRFRVR